MDLVLVVVGHHPHYPNHSQPNHHVYSGEFPSPLECDVHSYSVSIPVFGNVVEKLGKLKKIQRKPKLKLNEINYFSFKPNVLHTFTLCRFRSIKVTHHQHCFHGLMAIIVNFRFSIVVTTKRYTIVIIAPIFTYLKKIHTFYCQPNHKRKPV